MAIMHFRVSHVSRSSGRSAVQAAAYITGEKLHDSRTGSTSLYRRSEGAVHSWGVMAPENSPPEFKTLEGWNVLEKFEDDWADSHFKKEEAREHHKNSARVAMTIIGALPRELTLDQGEEIVREFIQKSFVDKGHYVTHAIHDEEGNPHVHMMVSHRYIEEDGSISNKKNRDVCTKTGLKNQRHLWAEITNKCLEMNGIEQRISAASYVDMGIDLIPTVHEGWHPQNLVKQGELSFLVDENQKIRDQNQDKILENPMIALDYMTKTNATFTMTQLMAKIEEFFPGNEKAVSYVYQAISDNLVLLGEDVSTEIRFTSKEYQGIENKAIASFNAVKDNSWGSVIPELDVMKHIYGINEELVRESGNPEAQLNEEQRKAIEGICQNHQVSVLVGRAGAGKTTSMRAIKNIFEEQGAQVIGAALSASAANNLGDDTGCFSETVRFYINRWEKLDWAREVLAAKGEEAKQYTPEDIRKAETAIFFGSKYELTDKSVFLVDEASMIGMRDWQKILDRVEKQNSKLVIVGDGRQFSAIDAGDMHRYMEDNIRSESRFELSEINRQKVKFMREASVELSKQNVHKALAMYENKGHVIGLAPDDLIQRVAADYVNRLSDNPNGVVLSYTHDACYRLNKTIRTSLQEIDMISKEETAVLGTKLSIGDKVVFLDNHRLNEGVKFVDGSGVDVTKKHFIRNGTTAVVEGIKLVEQEVKGEKVLSHQVDVKISDNLRATINTLHLEYGTISHGYAVTTHKSQGQTLDWTLVVASKHMDASAVYVAMTRHRHDMKLYYSEAEFESFAKLQGSLGRSSYKDMASDYTIRDENKIYFNNVESYRLITMEMAELISNENVYEGEPKERLKHLEETRAQYGRTILDQYDKHALYVSQAKLTKEKIEITCGLTERPLSLAEKAAKKRVQSYVSVVKDCRGTWNSLSKYGIGDKLFAHPDYLNFEGSKQVRDALALEIHLNKSLHRPFMREIGEKLGYGMSVIETQAKHALYRCDFKDNRLGLEVYLKEYGANPVSLKESEFWKTDEFKARGYAAMKITASHLHEKNQSLPKMTMMLTQEKRIDFVKLKQDALDYNRFLFAGALQDTSEKRHAELLVAYDMVRREAGRLYGKCDSEIKGHDGKFFPLNQTKGYAAYSEMKDVRESLVKELSQLDPQTTQSLSNLFGIKVDKILDGKIQAEKVQENPKSLDRTLEHLIKAKADYDQAISKEEISFTSFRNQQLSLKEIEFQLKDNIVSLAHDLFQGEKIHSKTSSQIRFGSKGSKVVIISGQKQGVYSDFETGEKGNAFKLIQSKLGISFKESVDWAQSWLGNPTREQLWNSFQETQRSQQATIEEKRFVTLYPAPKEPVDLQGNKFLNYALKDGKETMRFAYLDADKNLLGYVVRIEKDNDKVTLPLTYCKDLKSGNSYWKWRGFGKDAPLYGLDQLADKQKSPVLVVEGEKAAEAAKKQFPSYAVVSWPGGASAVTNANWAVLKGRDVIMWPDNDKAGFNAAHKVMEACNRAGAHTASIVRLPNNLPEKWDLADAYPKDFDNSKAKDLMDKTVSESQTNKQFKDQISQLKMEGVTDRSRMESLETFKSLIRTCESMGVTLSESDKNHLMKQSLFIAEKSSEIRQMNDHDPNKLGALVDAQKTAFLDSISVKNTNSLTITHQSISYDQMAQLTKDYDKSVAQIQAKLQKLGTFPEGLSKAMAESVIQTVNLCPALHSHMDKLIENQLVKSNDILEASKVLVTQHPSASKEQTYRAVAKSLQTSETPQQAAHKVTETLKADTRDITLQIQRQQQMSRGGLSL